MANPDIAPVPLRRCCRCQLWKQRTPANFSFSPKRNVWSSRCRPCATAVAHEHYWANHEANKAKFRTRCATRTDEERQRDREYKRVYSNRAYHALRAEMLNAYGSVCECCAEKELEFLTLARINDQAPKLKRPGDQSHLRDLKRKGWPKTDYGLLCWNCALSRHYGGACAHTADYRDPEPAHLANRKAVIAAYGGCCKCCGLDQPIAFLSVEHEKRDGQEHRDRTGGNVYYDLVKRGFPDEGITILCYNCNMARSHGRFCPHERGRQLDLLGEVA